MPASPPALLARSTIYARFNARRLLGLGRRCRESSAAYWGSALAMATEARDRIAARERVEQRRRQVEAPSTVRDDSEDEMVVSFPEFVFKEFIAAVAMTVFLIRSEEHTSELQSQSNLVCRLLLEKKKKTKKEIIK